MNWVDTVLSGVVPALILSALAWIALSVFDLMRKRALNLTTAETVSQNTNQPGFLKLDAEKRDAALKAGEAFDDYVVNRDTQSAVTEPTKAKGIAGKCTVFLALLSLLTGAIGALMRVEAYDNAIKKFGVWDNVVETVSNHTVGFVVAMAVIAVAVFNVVRAIQRGTA